MIQLANDPNANRSGWRAAANDGKAPDGAHKLSRPGHAWPFPSRYAERPAAQRQPKPAANDSGS